MIKSSVALPDEDTLEMPRSWMRHLHPRRGGHPGPKLASADVREDDLLARYAGRIEELLDHSKTDPALAAAAREHLDSEGSALGAAAIVAVHGAEKARLDPSRQEEALKRLRAFIAQTDDAEYRHIVSLLAGLRTTPARRILAAYLVPTELDWVAERCAALANSVPREMLLRSLGSAEHLEILGAGAHISVSDCYYVENLITLADGVGPAIAPFMVEAFDLFHDSAPRRKGLLDVLSRLPGDETFRQMLERAGNLHMMAALRDSMRRFPVRAIRVLAVASAGDAKARALLTDHLRAHAELVKQVLPDLPAGSRAVVEELWAADDRSPDAAADEVPRPLAVPRWERAEPKAKPVVVKGLPVSRERAMAWAPDERDDWLNRKIVTLVAGGHSFGRVPVPAAHTEGWARRVAEARSPSTDLGRMLYWQGAVLAAGPEDLVRPVLAEWQPDWRHERGLGRKGNPYDPDSWLRVIIARYEFDALPVALGYARARPANGAELLLPFLDGDVANAMADWLQRSPTVREAATAWFTRHGSAALPYVLPAAAGRAGKARKAAEHALRLLAAQEGPDAVLDFARAHDERAVEPIRTALDAEPDEASRTRKKPPAHLAVNAEVLPQVLLRGGGRALPVSAVRNLLTLLAMSTPTEPDPDLGGVLDACDDHSLSRFGWALFQHWRENGAEPREVWQFAALAWLGDDTTVRELVPMVRAWPGEGGHHHAVHGLDVLAAIGSDLALREIHAIAQKVKFKALKQRAQEKVEQIAAARGLTTEQLGDRLVPDLGLDADGTLVLDYGSRRFTAGFDEALRPYVIDQAGKHRSSLPKPGQRDDAALAPAAYRRFTDLKKDVRAIAGLQLQRLERSMTTGRRWPLPEFREFFAGHPLVWHIARRLVWIAEHGDTVTTFRLAEDRTFAGVDDDAVAVPDDAVIAIAHPLHLGKALPVWAQLFADYEILQPFPQLGREVHALTGEEKAAARLTRFEKVTVPFGNVLRLERRGWYRGPVDSDGGISCLVRPVGDGRYVVVTLATGLFVGYVSESGDQTIEAVWVGADPAPEHFSHSASGAALHSFGELDAVTASEVLADLTAVVSP
ncbi:DUF4132 domain-containing protein [Actinomadura luteofluorescens]|uniref:DUF4132 domain-containing protein n=1 Tax=Actinomadura luteofluorescens TaxID=46163 RepID=UPI002164EEBE|nr:DUF4132 domain-containing protein [Actinomadura glauciflava]